MKRASLLVVGVCAVLLAGPALAAGPGQPSGMGNMPMQSTGMHKPATHKPMAHKPMAHKPQMRKAAMHRHHRHKMSCYDYAWQSQDMKNCLARSGKMK